MNRGRRLPGPIRSKVIRTKRQQTGKTGVATLAVLALLIAGAMGVRAQAIMPVSEIRAGMHGVGKTIFQGNRIEDFQVDILGVMRNTGPKQDIILARLSGGPLAEAGVIQGMSGSPVYIDGKLIGAVALGFPFSKEPIAGIQPIEQMLAGTGAQPGGAAAQATAFGNMSQILTPLSFSGFSARTLQAFAPRFRQFGFEPQQGVSAGSPPSREMSGSVQAGSMISVQLISGDLSVAADGTVTYVRGKRIWAFGHPFMNSGPTEMPFARSEVMAVVPNLNSSFKASNAKEWVGTIVSDRSTAISGEIGRPAHTVPLSIGVKSGAMGEQTYHMQVVRDRLFTPLLTQMALLSVMETTARAIGAGSMRLNMKIEFEGAPPLNLHDEFVSDSALPQQVAADSVVELGFLLSCGFKSLAIKSIDYELAPVDQKHELHIAQAWTSAHQVQPGDTVTVNVLLAGEDGERLFRTVDYKVPIGAPEGQLNFTVSDANTLNFPEFAGMNAASARTGQELISMLNRYRGSEAAYVRVWRAEPAFTIAATSPGQEITDPPPSVMLVLADPSTSPVANMTQLQTRGSGVAELTIPAPDYVVTGAKTIQVDVRVNQ